jgi:hypothetical protein
MQRYIKKNNRKMFPYIENIVPTRVIAGNYTFEAQIGEGKTFLTTFCIDEDKYLIRFPDGKEERNSTDAIMLNRIRYNKIEPGLTQWLYMCLSKSMELYTLERYKPISKNISVDGLVYRLEYYQHNQDMKITMPGQAIICSRLAVTEKCHDILQMENMKVSLKVYDMLACSDLPSEGKEPKPLSGFSYVFKNTEPIEIGRRTYTMDYDPEADLIYLAHSGRIVMTQLNYFEKDAPELAYLHEGKVLKAIHAFLEENAIVNA